MARPAGRAVADAQSRLAGGDRREHKTRQRSWRGAGSPSVRCTATRASRHEDPCNPHRRCSAGIEPARRVRRAVPRSLQPGL